MIGANNLLSDLGHSETGGKPAKGGGEPWLAVEMAAEPSLIVEGVQEIVDLLRDCTELSSPPPRKADDDTGGDDAGGDDAGDDGAGDDGAGNGAGNGPDNVFVCKLLHVFGTQPWVAQANARIDAVNALLASRLRGATLIRPSMPAEQCFYDASGFHLSLHGYKKFVAQLVNLIPALSATAKAEAKARAKVVEDEAAAAMAEAQAALDAAQAARKALLSTKLEFSKAKAETAQAIQADANEATEAARIAAIEYTYWSEAVALGFQQEPPRRSQ